MTNQRRYFASVMQAVMIILLILSLLLIAQQASRRIYQAGIVLLVVSTFLQIGFGNIPSNATFGKSMKLLGIALAIIAMMFVIGIFFAPFFIKFTRG